MDPYIEYQAAPTKGMITMSKTQTPNRPLDQHESLVTFFISRAREPFTTVTEFRGNGTLSAQKERILERVAAETSTPVAYLSVTDTRIPSEFGFLHIYECIGNAWFHAGEVIYPIFKEASDLGNRVFEQLVMAQMPDSNPNHITFTQVPSTITGPPSAPVITPIPVANDQPTGDRG